MSIIQRSRNFFDKDSKVYRKEKKLSCDLPRIKNENILKKKMYAKKQIKLNIPQIKRNDSIIGHKPLAYLLPDREEAVPFRRVRVYDKLNMMKGFGELAYKGMSHRSSFFYQM